MDALDKSLRVIELYELYQELLTTKQREYVELYYYEDLSITEISENLGVSRNAVHDLLKRTVAKLEDFELKLHMREHYKIRKKLHKRLKDLVKDETILDVLKDLEKVE